MTDAYKRPLTTQRSSLGINQAYRVSHEEAAPDTRAQELLSDQVFSEVSEDSGFFTWAKFIVLLYYNKAAVHIFGYFTGWSWFNRVDKRLILGALPTPSYIKQLHARDNLCTIINMCAEFPGYLSLYDELSIQQIRLPTTDFSIPTVNAITKGVNSIIDTMENKDGVVYLHCKAGRGRSAVIALCYLLRVYRLTPVEAQEVLLVCRPQVDKFIYLEEQVREFYKEMISQADSGKFVRVPYN
ncbi:protein-tyrosine phosphatase-like protein [Phycomyces blakesleeanus]|uniref:Protein-tyrosine phosphatase-like protein n=1 Tax=Phycomyces blakesleeanus TaxID=4837 RepID=A0ABR3BGF8_PHYBL